MSTIKTAISIDETLFEQVEVVADELNVSRSRLFVLALEDYLRRYRNRGLLEQINAATQDEIDPAEQARLMEIRRTQRRAMQGEW